MSSHFHFELDDKSSLSNYREMKCLIKEYPSDFIVNEIDLNMNEADIIDTKLPPIPQDVAASPKDTSSSPKANDNYCEYSRSLQQSIESFAERCKERGFAESQEFPLSEGKKLSPDVLRDLSFRFPFLSLQSKAGSIILRRNPLFDTLLSLVDESEAFNIMSFILESRLNKDDYSTHTFTMSPQEDKEKRRQLHLFFKQKLPFIRTSTNQNSIILTTKRNMKRSSIQTNESKRMKPSFQGVLHFTLKKTNIELFSLKTRLCQLLHIHERALSFAGIKDKKAITTQFGTVRNITAEELLNACSQLPGVEVGGFEYVEKEIEIGQLWGNRFILTLRNVSCPWEDCVSNLQTIQRLGFVNYFGAQRLGQRDEFMSIPAQMGCYLLKKQWKEALLLFLNPGSIFTDEGSIETLNLYQKGEVKAALKRCPASAHILLAILRGLHRHGCDDVVNHGDDSSAQRDELYLEALRSLPSEQLLFYVKSFQSLVFNIVLQWRIHHYKDQLLDGDLFRRNGEEIANGTLQEVVLPLCGFDVNLPSNEVGKYYNQLLKELLGWEMIDFKRETSPFVLPGSYRSIIVKPQELQAGVNDLRPVGVLDASASFKTPFDLRLSFCLEKGCYATTMINEMTRGECIQSSFV